jgi:hypothetical protein
MRGRWPLYVLLASGLAFLASLFLPWRETTSPNVVFGTNPPLSLPGEDGIVNAGSTESGT